MPYDIQKKGTGYVVVNTMTGKEHSKKGIPKKRAEAQMKLLYGIEHGMVPRGKKESDK
jgi:hypothetical protein